MVSISKKIREAIGDAGHSINESDAASVVTPSPKDNVKGVKPTRLDSDPLSETRGLGVDDQQSEPENAAQTTHLQALVGSLELHRQKFGPERPPRILVCGERGAGKTTTINTLFGEDKGAVGWYDTGTTHDELYEWVCETDVINIVDLPGLGDSKRKDRAFEAMYRKHVPKADGIIVVVEAGKGAKTPTVRTVEILLKCGVNPKLINFAYNKLSEVSVPVANGRPRKVDCDEIRGVWRPEDKIAVLKAKEAFLVALVQKIREDIPRVRFSIDQVVEYDSQSGWNMEVLLTRLGAQLPQETLRRFEKSLDAPERQRHKRIRALTGSDPPVPALSSVRKSLSERFLEGMERGIDKVAGMVKGGLKKLRESLG